MCLSRCVFSLSGLSWWKRQCRLLWHHWLQREASGCFPGEWCETTSLFVCLFLNSGIYLSLKLDIMEQKKKISSGMALCFFCFFLNDLVLISSRQAINTISVSVNCCHFSMVVVKWLVTNTYHNLCRFTQNVHKYMLRVSPVHPTCLCQGSCVFLLVPTATYLRRTGCH